MKMPKVWGSFELYEHWINGDIILKLSPSFAFLNISIIQENTEVEGALFVYSR